MPETKSPGEKCIHQYPGYCHIVVTSLTFQGHVTSSVTWPFDSPYAISYWWFFGTKSLSLRFPRYSTSNVTQRLTWPWYDL